jgi:Zn-finger nucleic acid-binding protein
MLKERTSHMKCPACFNELRPLQVGSLVVDACQGGCGGIWFDAFELQRVDEEEEAAGGPLLEIARDPRVLVDSSRKRECPRCAGVKLHRHFFSAKRRVEVDQCPNCGGYWLDAGELASIRAEKSAGARAAQMREGSIAPETIRYLYQLQSQHRRMSGGSD